MTNAERIRGVHAERCGDPHHRYRSWEHCHAHFQVPRNRRQDDEGVRLACLHLGFYLASWGMYRGSSFLLQKDYPVHERVVRCMFDPGNEPLWDCDARILGGDALLAGEIFALARRIKDAYVDEFRNSRNDRKDKSAADVSDTLVTKVLLGTMGCCPAYDEYFVKGATRTIKPARFGVNSLKGIIRFIETNRAELLGVRAELAKGSDGVRYPLMKLVDMCFWQKGYEEAEAEEARKGKKA